MRRDPDAVLHRAEAEEAQPPGEPDALEPAVLRDLVPDDGPPIAGGPRGAEREDPPVALGEQPVAARRDPVVDEPPGPHALEQPAAHEPRQRHPGGAVREAELAEQRHEAARPDRPPPNGRT